MLLLSLTATAQLSIDLSGEWKVNLLQNGKQSDAMKVVLPGTLDDASIGEANSLEPMLQKPQLSRLTRKHSFIGTAIYQRDIYITHEMAAQPLQLLFERVMWRSRLAIDGRDIGQMQESLVAPHHFLINDGLTEGRHTLTLTIDNSKLHDISVDNLAHSYTNDTQIMWNGVLGRMELSIQPFISDVQVYPDIDHQQAIVKVKTSATQKAPSLLFMLDGRTVKPMKTGSDEY